MIIDFHHAVRQFKHFILEEALLQNDCCVIRTAEALKLHRNTVNNLIKEFAIDLDVLKGKEPKQEINGADKTPLEEFDSSEYQR